MSLWSRLTGADADAAKEAALRAQIEGGGEYLYTRSLSYVYCKRCGAAVLWRQFGDVHTAWHRSLEETP